MSGPGALSVGARHSLCRGRRSVSWPGAPSLCRGPALCVALCVGARRFVSGPGGPLSTLFLSGPGALCWGFLSRSLLSGPGALCVGVQRSLRRGPALSVRGRRWGPAVLSQDSIFQAPAVCVSGPIAFCLSLEAQRSVCRRPALFVSGPGALSVGARRSLCRGPALFYRAPALSVRVWSPDCFCIGARRSSALSVWGPGGTLRRRVCGDRRSPVVSETVAGPALFVSGPGALCRAPALCRARRSLCRGPVLSVRFVTSWRSVRGPALCVGTRRSLCRGRALCHGARRSLRRGPALCAWARQTLFLSGPALCVGAFCRGLCCRGPALFVSGCSAPCVGARHSLSGPGGPLPRVYFPGTGGLCVGAHRFLCRRPALFVSGPGALSVGPGALCVGARRSFYRAPALSVRVWSPDCFRRVCGGPAVPGGVGDCRCFCEASAVSGTASPLQSCTCGLRASHPRGPPAPVRVPPIQPGASMREPQALLFV